MNEGAASTNQGITAAAQRVLTARGLTKDYIGLAFLIGCLFLRRWLLAQPLGTDRALLGEGLLILGWVAMWRPTEALLYDWWPLVARRALLHRLAVIAVEVRAGA